MVIAIIGVVAATVGLSFSGTEARQVGHEADRFASIVRSARDQAVLENRLLVVAVSHDGYRFSRRTKRAGSRFWTTISFAPGIFPAASRSTTSTWTPQMDLGEPRILFPPRRGHGGGDRLYSGDIRRTVRVQTDGTVVTEAAHA